mgnify:CR=1 FL=1|jgi:hypothetical protein|tara:strand:+ start:20 stop:1243 length:1224 start_codon:yes stop_codon:yes gene_type:complete
MCNTCGCKKAESFEAEEFVAEGKKVKSVIENAMKEYDEYVADKEAYDDDDIISFEEWFDWHLGDDELDGDEETLEYLKTLPSYNSPESNSWIWKMYHGAETFDAEMPNIVIPHGVDITSKIEKLSQRLGKHRIMSQDLRDKQFEAESFDAELISAKGLEKYIDNEFMPNDAVNIQEYDNGRVVREGYIGLDQDEDKISGLTMIDRDEVMKITDDEEDEVGGLSIEEMANMSFSDIDRKSGFVADRLNHTPQSWSELSKMQKMEILFRIKNNEPWLDWVGFDADFDNAPYDSFDEAMSDNVSFPEKEYEIDDRDIYNPERAAMDMIRSNRALREQMEEQGVYVGRHPGYYDDNGQWVELMEHYDDYERIPNWLQGLVGVGLVGGLAFILNKMTNTFADTGNNTTEPTE